MAKRKTYYEHAMIDYTSAKVLYTNQIFNSSATHCQQAAEKFMKHVVEVLDIKEEVDRLLEEIGRAHV